MSDEWISGDQAWMNACHHRSRWKASRFRDEVVQPEAPHKVTIKKADRFFCIGSCFARNIEDELICRDINVLSKEVISPRNEFAGRPTSLVNKYTTASILNELEWLIHSPRPQDALVEERDGWRDMQLHSSGQPVSFKRGIARRRYLIDHYFRRISEADVLLITLGLVESWFDAANGLYLNIAPSPWQIRRHHDRFRLERTDVAKNIARLMRIREIVKSMSPACRIIVTVSPVPMSVSFTGQDVMVANTILRRP